jgi:hypothetical protein
LQAYIEVIAAFVHSPISDPEHHCGVGETVEHDAGLYTLFITPPFMVSALAVVCWAWAQVVLVIAAKASKAVTRRSNFDLRIMAPPLRCLCPKGMVWGMVWPKVL